MEPDKICINEQVSGANLPDRETIDELVRRIRDVADPLRIILFGSAARGDMRADSDLDVLVVVPDGTHRRKTAQNIYMKLYGFGKPVDVLVSTPEHLEKHKDNIGLIYRTVLAEGREIYDAGTH
jgi:predicted nucleotidyltransferase